jgi:23S rRNA (uracil1939-C5)-methyltransferase
MSTRVEITSLAYRGMGVGKIDGKVVFVPFAAPGDEALVEITSEKKFFSYAALIDVLKPSDIRQEPVCRVFGRCGGCHWQHIQYAEQLKWKHEIFAETLKRIGGFEVPSFDPPVGSPLKFNYRSRARFHTESGAWGFFEARSHRVVDIDGCPLLDPLLNETFRGIKALLNGADTTLHTVEIGGDLKKKTAVASFHVKKLTGFDWSGALKEVPCLKGFEVWQKDPENRGRGRRVITEGETRLFYNVGKLTLGADISVFSQANALQNENLVQRVIEMAALDKAARSHGDCIAADLFCGAGNLTIPIAVKAVKTIGVDSDREAVKNARENATMNNAASVRFVRERAGVTRTLEKSRPHVIVLDPPRGGGLDVAKALAGLEPQRIIYVSCSPPTLARDISFLTRHGYSPFKAGVIDMFPQTYHIEGVIGLNAEPI